MSWTTIGFITWGVGIVPAALVFIAFIVWLSDHDGKWANDSARKDWVKSGLFLCWLSALWWPFMLPLFIAYLLSIFAMRHADKLRKGSR